MNKIRFLFKKYFFIILTVLFTLSVFIVSIHSLLKIITSLAPDFSIFWVSARNLTNYRNPYINSDLFTINAYPPSTFIFYIPLALLPYQFAQAIFTVLNFLAIPATIFLSLKILNEKISIYQLLLLISLVLISFPTKFTLGMGQINIIAYLTILYSYYFYKENKPEISGILLGAAYLLKPVLGFILLFYILKAKWKVVLYSLCIPILATLLIVLGFGVTPFVYWIKQIIPQLLGLTGREVYYNQGLMGFISRLTSNLTTRTYLNTAISIILITFTSLIARIKKIDKNLQFALFTIALLLIDPLSWQHHFVWLIFPFAMLVKYTLKTKKTVFWILLIFAYLLVSWNFKNPQFFSTFPKSLLLSNTFYGAVLVYLLTFYCLLVVTYRSR